MGPTHFYGARAEKNQKADFAMKKRIYVALAAT